MSSDVDYPYGAPCWIEAIAPDPAAAADFYTGLLGWAFDPPAERLGGPYLLARVDGRPVAGIGQGPAAVWSTSLRVDDRDAALTQVTDAGGIVLLAALDAGEDRGAVVADPSGVAFGVRERAGAGLRGAPGTWAMSALHTPDPERAQAFYGRVFGWEFQSLPGGELTLARLPGYAAPGDVPGGSSGGGSGGDTVATGGLPPDAVAVIAPAPVGGPVPAHWAVNVAVADADATLARGAELGGRTLMEPVETPGLRSAVLSDPQGGVLAISAPA